MNLRCPCGKLLDSLVRFEAHVRDTHRADMADVVTGQARLVEGFTQRESAGLIFVRHQVLKGVMVDDLPPEKPFGWERGWWNVNMRGEWCAF